MCFIYFYLYCFIFSPSLLISFFFFFFFFNDTATTEIYTLSLHDALPICHTFAWHSVVPPSHCPTCGRSEEHTSELQSRVDLVCRLLLEKKKKNTTNICFIIKKKSRTQDTNFYV